MIDARRLLRMNPRLLHGARLPSLTHSATVKVFAPVSHAWSGSKVMVSQKKSPKRGSKRQVHSAPALAKGLEIIELLGDIPAGLSISEIAARLGRSLNEVFRVIVVMEGRGWLRKDPSTD